MYPKSNLSIPVGQQVDKVMYPPATEGQTGSQWQASSMAQGSSPVLCPICRKNSIYYYTR